MSQGRLIKRLFLMSVPSTWYFERLSAYVLFGQLIPRLFCGSLRPKEIYYIDAGLWAEKISVFLLGLWKVPCKRLNFRMVDIVDYDGNLVYLSLSFRELLQIQQKIC